MRNIIIRKASMDDLSFIQSLNHQLFVYEVVAFNDESFDINWPYNESGINYFKEQIEKELLLVAEVNNIVAGYISWYTYINSARKDKNHAELDNILVLNEYRKAGIGTRLVESFKEICKESNINYIMVSTNLKNNDAIAFYEKNGFEKYEITLKQKIDS